MIWLLQTATWSQPIMSASGFLSAILAAFSFASLKLSECGLSPGWWVSSIDGSTLEKGMPKLSSNVFLYFELDASTRFGKCFFIVVFLN